MVSTYFLNCIMGNVFKSKVSPALPTKFYLGLSTSAPTLTGGGITEPSSTTGYKRVAVTSSLSVPTDGVISNKSEISFPRSSASWGTITHFVLFDAETGGNFLLSESLTKSRLIEDSTIVILETGKLKITLANVS